MKSKNYVRHMNKRTCKYLLTSFCPLMMQYRAVALRPLYLRRLILFTKSNLQRPLARKDPRLFGWKGRLSLHRVLSNRIITFLLVPSNLGFSWLLFSSEWLIFSFPEPNLGSPLKLSHTLY